MTTIRRPNAQPQISLRDTEPRVTPQPPSRRFAETLGEGAHALLDGVEQAAGLLPGGNAVAAAVRGGISSEAGGAPGASGAGVAGTTGVTPGQAQGGSLQGMLDQSSSTAEQLLALQHQMAMEQRMFQTTSNVLKARHDTSKAVIQNVR